MDDRRAEWFLIACICLEFRGEIPKGGKNVTTRYCKWMVKSHGACKVVVMNDLRGGSTT